MVCLYYKETMKSHIPSWDRLAPGRCVSADLRKDFKNQKNYKLWIRETTNTRGCEEEIVKCMYSVESQNHNNHNITPECVTPHCWLQMSDALLYNPFKDYFSELASKLRSSTPTMNPNHWTTLLKKARKAKKAMRLAMIFATRNTPVEAPLAAASSTFFSLLKSVHNTDATLVYYCKRTKLVAWIMHSLIHAKFSNTMNL